MQFLFRRTPKAHESYLEHIRRTRGEKACVRVFRRTCAINLTQAVDYLNDPQLRYVTLYLLLDDVQEQSLYPHLNQRNLRALLITTQIKVSDPVSQRVNYLSASDPEGRAVLQWMLESRELGPAGDATYQQVMEVVWSTYRRQETHGNDRFQLKEDLTFR